jgi:gamma-glutamyltranspeptidase / glutathione hydrolase
MHARIDRRTFLTAAGSAAACLAASSANANAASLKGRGLVVGQAEGAAAGMDVLADGGNAVDAIVAAALVAGVVAVSKCGIGGYGGHMTIGLASGKLTCIDFNSEAPAAARADMFRVDPNGKVEGDANMHGWLAAGVPATLAGLQLALDKYGTQPFARVVRPAIRYARDGFPVDSTLKFWLDPAADVLSRDPASARLFFRNGKPLAKGDNYRNPDLAVMLERLADKGSVADFYSGEIGRKIADAIQKNGGIVTAADMAAYRPVEQVPLSIDWRGHTIATAPLTAGGLTVLQTIATLKALDWNVMPKGNPARIQAWLEALRIAWGDRLALFGDPRFVKVPVERLLSEKYAQESAAKIKSAIAHRRPVSVATSGSSANGTVNLSAVDDNGMMAAMTLTHGDAFGAQVTVDGLGLILGHGMSRFEPAPGKLNSIAPGKRPLDNMCPTVVLRDGKPTLAIGGVGGRRIPNAVFQVLLHVVGEGSSLETAAEKPRLHTEGGLEVFGEPGRPAAETKYLQAVGYAIKEPKPSFVAGVQIDPMDKGRPSVGVEDFTSQRTNPPGNRDPHPKIVRSKA